MRWTILGSGGCTVIPKPLCRCRICREARVKGFPYARTGPAAYLHEANLLLDTPAEISQQLNRAAIRYVNYLMFSHLDPDHVEGFRVVEQIALDYRTWRAHPEKRITLRLPEPLAERIVKISSQYGPVLDFYLAKGFVKLETFKEKTQIGNIQITALPVDRGTQTAYVYVFEQAGRKAVYAPCDMKPFPVDRPEVQNADLLITQPGRFDDHIKHGFRYPPDHISRTTLYSFGETLALAAQIKARKTVFMHLEEHWHRSYDDYRALEKQHRGIRFARDGMSLRV